MCFFKKRVIILQGKIFYLLQNFLGLAVDIYIYDFFQNGIIPPEAGCLVVISSGVEQLFAIHHRTGAPSYRQFTGENMQAFVPDFRVVDISIVSYGPLV